MTYPTVFLLRHGQTEWNLEGRLQGHRDSALTARGRAQGEAQRAILAPILKALPDIAIHSSPLGRAFETAKIAADGHPVLAQDGLKEVSAGRWEGRLRAEIVAERGFGSADEKDMFALFLTAPDGEGEAALEARVRGYLASLTGPTVIVSHGVVSAFLRGVICNVPRAEVPLLPHTQGVVTALHEGQATELATPEAAAQFLSDKLTDAAAEGRA